jgi:hypothetical protein
MSLKDFELYALNSVAMAVSFTQVEQGFKLVLLAVSIVYTVMKIIDLVKKKKDGKINE